MYFYHDFTIQQFYRKRLRKLRKRLRFEIEKNNSNIC